MKSDRKSIEIEKIVKTILNNDAFLAYLQLGNLVMLPM